MSRRHDARSSNTSRIGHYQRADRKDWGGDAKIRTCLNCDVPFKSLGKTNRICPRCAKLDSHTGGIVPIHLDEIKGPRRSPHVPHS